MVEPIPNSEIPAFLLYGEAPGGAPFRLHIETIAARSRRHDWRIASHRHRGLHQVLWVAGGAVAARLGSDEVEGRGPLAMAIPPGYAHSFAFAPETQGFVLTFDARALLEGEGGAGATFAALFASPRMIALDHEPEAAAGMTALLGELAAEYAAPDAAGSPAPLWLARAAIWRLARFAGSHAHARGRAFPRFLALVEAHFREGWPISAYAHSLGLSVRRLNRLAQAEAGLNALACVHRRLLREASEQLAHLDAPIAHIAFDLGFDDPAYFTRFFKRMTGTSPRAFREGRRGQELPKFTAVAGS